MVARLRDDYVSGVNVFEQPGEALFGFSKDGRLLGVGGLNRERHPEYADSGRVRRVYVLPDFRRQGIGTTLVRAIIEHGLQHFRRVTCHVGPRESYQFYERLGFQRTLTDDVTHVYHPEQRA